MPKLDTVGVYQGTITESIVNVTRNGFPQWVARLQAAKKFVDVPADLEHFKNQGVIEEAVPQWIDWSGFNEDIVAYMVMFKSNEVFGPETALLNYEQIQLATGWEGTSFELLGVNLVGKEIQFRVEDHEYEGKTSLQVNWVDAINANPVRELKALDANQLKALSAKLVTNKAKPTVAKPAAKPSAKPASKPATQQTASAPKPVSSPASTPSEPAAAPAPAKAKAKAAPKAPEAAADDGCTKDEAWSAICDAKGDNDDGAVAEAWIAACSEVGEDKDEDAFTPKDWARVRTVVFRDLALK